MITMTKEADLDVICAVILNECFCFTLKLMFIIYICLDYLSYRPSEHDCIFTDRFFPGSDFVY